MPIRFKCLCGQKLKSPDESIGKRAKCPKCDLWFHVPESQTYNTIASQIRPKHKSGREEAPVAAVPDPAEEGVGSGRKGKVRVVIADSVAADLAMLAEMLNYRGYEVLETNDGEKAVELVRKADPDAVVLDVHLENLGGFQVVRQIHDPANVQNKNVWTVPVLMTAAKVRGRDKQYAMSLGVDGYFPKPLTPAQLCHQLEREITKYRSR